jgi:hypothetical protein
MNTKLKFVMASSVLALGATFLSGASPAVADTVAAVTVTPATGLVDGQTVEVAVSGYQAGETVSVAECAALESGVVGCAYPDAQSVVADSEGNATASLVVRTSFEAYNIETGEPAGIVDCLTVPGGCGIGAANDEFSTIASAVISFV